MCHDRTKYKRYIDRVLMEAMLAFSTGWGEETFWKIHRKRWHFGFCAWIKLWWKHEDISERGSNINTDMEEYNYKLCSGNIEYLLELRIVCVQENNGVVERTNYSLGFFLTAKCTCWLKDCSTGWLKSWISVKTKQNRNLETSSQYPIYWTLENFLT